MDGKENYLQLKDVYEGFCKFLKWQIDSLCKENNIELSFPIEYRVKTWESIEGKLMTHEDISEWQNFNDIAGVRVITVFHKDVERLENLLREQYQIIKEEDKNSSLGENEFGYQSVHMDIKLKSNLEHTAGIKPFVGLKAEIQVRTAAQHIWAVASHKLQYKTKNSTPKSLRRSVNRLSALLELVDEEFSRLDKEKNDYAQRISTKAQENEVINATLLEVILDKLYPVRNKQISEPYSEMVEQLKAIGITKVKDLEEVINVTMKDVLQEDEEAAINITLNSADKNDLKDYFYSHIGLLRCAISCRYPNISFSYNRVTKDEKIIWTRQ